MSIKVTFSTDDNGDDNVQVDGVTDSDTAVTITVHRASESGFEATRQVTISPPEINLVEADLEEGGIGTLVN